MKKIELLAPAGNLEALKAAVENGANAVYVGGQQFSARKSADNFDEETLLAGVDYAHARGVKVYGALNTLVANEEIQALLDEAYLFASVGIDAVIIQDLGVAHLLRWTLPQLKLHASTQMAVHNTLGVKQLQDMGFKRVVLARETSLETIKEILDETEVEIETFIHGALCVAYSGQCLLSSMIGGRSGNRGQCAQPCRMKYQLVDNTQAKIATNVEGQYLLSTRDLNMIEHIPALIKAGIHSLKIEGRMKRPEYVATVVKHYRQAIDDYEHQGNYLASPSAKQELLQIFNREFTTGYYFNNPGQQLMSYSRPDNRGVYLGQVVQTGPRKVTIQLAEDLAVGDGYMMINGKGEEIAGKVKDLMVKGQKVEQALSQQTVMLSVSGDTSGCVHSYKTYDQQLMQRAVESYRKPSEPEKQAVNFHVTLRLGEPIGLLAWDGFGQQVYRQSSYLVEKAMKHPSDLASATKQLERLGNTPFRLGEVVADIDLGVIAPASELNQLRREIIDALIADQVPQSSDDQEPLISRGEYYDVAGDLLDRIPPSVYGYGQPQLSVHVGNFKSMQAAVDHGADRVLISLMTMRGQDNFNEHTLAEAIRYIHQQGKQILVTLPPIMDNQQNQQMSKWLQQAKDLGADGVMVSNMGNWRLAQDMSWDNVLADYHLNVFNDITIQYLSSQAIAGVTLSPELTLNQISDCAYIGNLPLEVIVHGYFPLMISAQCVVGSTVGGRTSDKACTLPCHKGGYQLKDRMGVTFPLAMDNHCRMYVYNSKVLNLYKKVCDILKSGIDYIRIEGKEKDAQWIATTTSHYRAALDHFGAQKNLTIDMQAVDELEGLDPQGSTYGHYFRGVL